MRPHTSSFSRHLIGSNRLPRPAFFLAYVVFWGHMLIGLTVGFFFDQIEGRYFVSLITVGSCSLGLIVYGSITRQTKYLLNIFGYSLITIEIWKGPNLGHPFSIAALIITATSLYLVIYEQMSTYRTDRISGSKVINQHWQSIVFFSFIIIITAILIRFQTII
ncbi:MAG: hypothetical protein CME10_14630 [Gemmatimonadetes bacterium]|nr:hypothetical protein [Gemmatimonadota bacterium]